MRNIVVAVLLLLSGQYLTEANAGRPTSARYSMEDILAYKRVAQVSASPDGKQVVFTTFQAQSGPSGRRWEYSLFLRDQQGKIDLLVKKKQISTLGWSNDGKRIAYIAEGKKFQSIWIQDITSRKSKKLIEFSSDIDSFKWSPDGKYIAFTAGDAGISLSKKPTLTDVYTDYTNKRVYLLSVRSGDRKPAYPLTPSNCSVSGFDWSPADSQSIVFAYQPRAGHDYANRTRIGILHLKTGGITPIPYTETHSGIQPAYSPDGRWIAFRAGPDPEETASALSCDITLNGRICVADTVSLESYCLAKTFNENPMMIGWNESGDSVLVFDVFKTEGMKIYALSLNPSAPAQLVLDPDGFIEPLTISINSSRRFLSFRYETVSEAPEAYICRTNSFKLEQVSRLQSQPADPFPWKTEVINWKSRDGMDIEGLLITRSGCDSQKKYPLLVNVHGGPAGAWFKRYLGGCDEYMQMFDPTACPGSLLSMGFAVLQPNPRGSGGYGKAFRLANFGDFGGGDYQDVMTGVDYLVQRGIADPHRLAIAGWSFGGYMTAWAISQTDRFKAAVTGAGNTNFISFSGTSDIPDYYLRYLGSAFWDDNGLYLQRAPISFVKNIRTPLLILHGRDDVRVPVSQAYELYFALMKQDKPVRMLVSPNTGHVPTNPDIIYQNIKAVNEWLSQALEPQ
ncbi:MAG: prolyl oligopeptidase family serine peptidase [Syntrophobacteraceae bacterium]